MHPCKNNPENSSTTKVSKHNTWRYSTFAERAFDNNKKINMITTEVKIV